MTESLETLLPPRPLQIPDGTIDLKEAALMISIVRALRREHDPTGALDLLNQYAESFPEGLFKQEAVLARIEAHLGLKQHAAALAILDATHLDAIPHPREARLLRAELRAAEGRCKDALGDFTAAQAAAGDETTARARRGEAVCRLRLRDEGSGEPP